MESESTEQFDELTGPLNGQRAHIQEVASLLNQVNVEVTESNHTWTLPSGKGHKFQIIVIEDAIGVLSVERKELR